MYVLLITANIINDYVSWNMVKPYKWIKML